MIDESLLLIADPDAAPAPEPSLASELPDFPHLVPGPEGRLGVKLPKSSYWLVDPYVGDYDRAQTAYHAAYAWAKALPESDVLKLKPSRFKDITDVTDLADEIATMHAIQARDDILIPRIIVDTLGRRVLPDQYTERQLRKLFKNTNVLEFLHPWIWQLLADASDPLD